VIPGVPAQGSGPEWSARSVYPGAHAVLTVSAIAIVAVFVAVARTFPPSAPELTTVLRVAGALEFLTVVVVMKLLTGQIEPLGAGGDVALWWATHGPRALVVWALAEGTVVVGSAFWFLARDLALLIPLAGFGIGALLWMRPGRLVAG